MTMFTKRKNELGIAIEEVAGTPVAPTHYIPFLDCTLNNKIEIISDEQAKGTRFGEGSDSIIGKKSGEGKIEVVLDPTTAPYWFALAMGSIVSEAKGQQFAHTCSLSDSNEPLTATIWRNIGIDTVQFSNSVISSFEMSFADNVAKLSMDIISKSGTTQSRTSSLTTDLELFTFKNATVTIGTTEIKVEDFKLKVDNDPESLYAPGDNDVDRIAVKTPKITGSFKLVLESDDQYDAYNGLEKQALSIEFEGATDTIEIKLPQIRIDGWSEDGGNDDLAREAIDFVVEESDESGEEIPMTVVITNSVEEYAPAES